MKNFFQVVILSLFLATILVAQPKPSGGEDPDQYAAVTAWARYKVTAARASVMFPKFPVRTGGVGGVSCNEIQGNTYFAYADEAVYEFRYVSKGPKPPEGWCDERVFFGPEALARRISEIENNTAFKESEGLVGSRKMKIYRGETPNERLVSWLIPDLENDRWFELAISSRLDKKPDEKRFLESLAFSADAGVEIADGSPVILGDKGVFSGPAKSETPMASTTSLLIKAKPRPGYTEIARQKSIQGTVVLKVTFLANGGIGDVAVIKGSSEGLTEQTVAAVKRIVFLPARANGRPVTTVKNLEYSFSIY